MEPRFRSIVTKSVVLSFATTPVTIQNQDYQNLADIFPLLRELELFPQQKEQLVQFHQEIRFQIEQILTYRQYNQFEFILSEDGNFRKALGVMNLSADKWMQLRRIFNSYCIKLANLFTPQQQRQILQNLRNRWKQNRNESIKHEETIKNLTALLKLEIASEE